MSEAPKQERNPMPSYEDLSKRLSYDPLTGKFTRQFSKSRTDWVGKETGKIVDKGSRGKYVWVKVGQRWIVGHRIAWLLYYGSWPTGTIDHIDGDGTNNRIENLRDVTLSENMKNKKKYKCKNINENPYPGVRKNPRCSTWTAGIRVNGRMHVIGHFRTAEEAITAKKNAEKQHGFHKNHGREK